MVIAPNNITVILLLITGTNYGSYSKKQYSNLRVLKYNENLKSMSVKHDKISTLNSM